MFWLECETRANFKVVPGFGGEARSTRKSFVERVKVDEWLLNGWMYFISVFFFQAEDGIRDVAVTGVQTCALPIFPRTSHPELRASIVAAEITELIPGAGPPPHRIPSFTVFLPRELPRGGPGHSRPGHLPVSPISGRRPGPRLKARPLGAEFERGPP